MTLKIAVPNKGSLSDAASVMLREAGYIQRNDARELILQDSLNDVEFYFLRPRDIAVYVAAGQLDIGITGRDLLLDSGVEAEEILELGFGQSTFRFAAAPGVVTSIKDLDGHRIATSYPGLVSRYLEARSLRCTVVRLDGAVESAVRLGVADVIADVVSTGTTLRQAGLEIFGEPILESQAVLIQRVGSTVNADVLIRRLQGVIIARQYVIMDYDVEETLLEEACAITPGLESPTISPLRSKGWVAVRAMVLRSQTNQVMDQLWELGARGILVTDIHACRL